METMTEPIWGNWMRRVHDGLKPEQRPKPAGVKTMPAFVIRNKVGLGSVEPSPANDLYPSWYQNTRRATGNRTIDKVSNKLATECTPERAKENTNEAGANAFSGDRFVGGGSGNPNTDEKDDIHKCTDVKPGISLNVSTTGTSYNLSVDVQQGTHAISSDRFKGTVNYIIDGQTIQSFTIDGPGAGLAAFTYTPNFSGTRTITAQIIDSVLYDSVTGGTTITGIQQSGQPTTSGN